MSTTASTGLSIDRIRTGHGRSLLVLGRAAEYLANSRRFLSEEPAQDADDEAIHLLKGLSRDVFEDYSEVISGRQCLEGSMLSGQAACV